MTTTKARKMRQATCYHCKAECQVPNRKSAARDVCSNMDCLRAETDMHNAAVAAYNAERAAERAARPRQRRQPQALYGDFAMLARMNGIATDGTGRKVR